MDKKNQTKEQIIRRIVKKRKACDIACGAGLALAALGTMSGIITGMVGFSFHAEANDNLRMIENDTKRTVSFDTFVSQKQQQLKDDFAQGKITYLEFKDQYEQAYSYGTIREYADETNNEVLQSQIASIDNHKRLGNELLLKGMGTSVGVAISGVGLLLGADQLYKKYSRKQEEIQIKQESEMAD